MHKHLHNYFDYKISIFFYIQDMDIENIFEQKHHLALVDDLVERLNDFQKHIKNRILTNLEANSDVS